MAATGAERAAAHKARKEAILAETAVEIAKISEENRTLRQKLADLEAKMAVQTANHAKKVALLEKKLLSALEKVVKL